MISFCSYGGTLSSSLHGSLIIFQQKVDETFLSQYDIKSSKGMKLSLAVNKDGTEEMLDFPFKDGLVELPDNWDATFDIVTGDDMILPCKCSKDPIFLVGFGFWDPWKIC